MTYLNDRLREERKRLGLNQGKFAALGCVTKDTQLNYENGSRKPDSAYLEALSLAGVDVFYVLTGKISSDALTDDENALLTSYRKLDIRGKAGALGAISGMSAPPASHVEFHGQVGQQINGDITGPQTINMGGSKKKTKE